MAGEPGFSTAAEIKGYADEAAMQGISELHFYAAEEGVNATVWDGGA